MKKDAKIYVAGHRGLVGSALIRRLESGGFRNLVYRTSAELDLRSQDAVERFFADEKPDFVFLSAAKVGGILANDSQPADFLRDNLQIQTNVIDSAWRNATRKLLFLGSSCIYPKHAPQPMPESCLLTGPLEPTNEWYAIAKIAGIKMCQAYRLQYGFNAICAMPTNLYGPEDNFNLGSSHVLPALMRKCHEARAHGQNEVVVWGTGTPRREFLYADDLADALVFLMTNYEEGAPINVGSGEDISIANLVSLVKGVVGFSGAVRFDSSRPDGTPRKLLDVSRLSALGWSPRTSLRDGITSTYAWFLEHLEKYRD